MTFSCFDLAAATLGSYQQKGREAAFRCPNHDDSHPSLLVNPKKDCWICGPCAVGGSAWKLAAFISGFGVCETKNISEWLRSKGL